MTNYLVQEKLKNHLIQILKSKSSIEYLGKKLHLEMKKVDSQKSTEFTEKFCIKYISNFIIAGYNFQMSTIYGQLENILNQKIEPAPDEWDRLYNVDFFIKIKESYIGLQIKPAGYDYIPQMINEKQQQKKTHEKFTKKYGGKVFYIFSITEGKNKIIQNKEVIEEIQQEIERLNKK